jgi:hypothetical protein
MEIQKRAARLVCGVIAHRSNASNTTILIASLSTLFCSAVVAAPPKMLCQDGATKNVGAAGGARTAFSIMRLPDGSFALYNRYAPEAGPLTLPDADQNMHTLLTQLPPQILDSEAIMTSGVLDNTQVILTTDNELNTPTAGEPHGN